MSCSRRQMMYGLLGVASMSRSFANVQAHHHLAQRFGDDEAQGLSSASGDVMIKEDLRLPNFVHIHNAAIRKIGAKLYLLALAWNPGDFAILEQV